MKPTDEMVERAFAVSLGGRVLIRNILEAALVDVPQLTTNECAALIGALIAIEAPGVEASVGRLVEKLTEMARLNACAAKETP